MCKQLIANRSYKIQVLVQQNVRNWLTNLKTPGCHTFTTKQTKINSFFFYRTYTLSEYWQKKPKISIFSPAQNPWSLSNHLKRRYFLYWLQEKKITCSAHWPIEGTMVFFLVYYEIQVLLYYDELPNTISRAWCKTGLTRIEIWRRQTSFQGLHD